jgi:serine protease Do
MKRYLLTGIALLPLLLNYSHAAQSLAEDPQLQPWGYLSEDTGTGAYLGVDVADVTTDRMAALKLKEEKGVEITMVDQDAPAGKAGIHEHDVILTMNDTPVDSGAQLRRMIHETPPGRVVTLGLSRDGQPLTIKVQLGDKHKEFAMMSKGKSPAELYVVPPIPPMPNIEIPEINVMVVRSSARSGLMVENLTQQLGEFFGVHDGNGVLVRSVERGSRAEKAGLRAGDIIVKVNGEAVHDTDDFTRTLRSNNGGSNTVGVIRDKKEQNLNLTLPDHKGNGENYSKGPGDTGKMEEESFDDSDIDMDADVYETTRLTQELAQLQPEINLAVAQSQAETMQKAQKAAEAAQAKAVTQAARALQCAQSKAFEKQMELQEMNLQKMQIELPKQIEFPKIELPKIEYPKMNFQLQLGPELKEQMQRQQREFERMQHEMQGDWTDI